MSIVARDAARGRGIGKKTLQKRRRCCKRGVCALKNDGCGIQKPKRSSLYCRQCRKYFHLACFFSTHSCYKVDSSGELAEEEEGEEEEEGDEEEDSDSD